MNTNFATEAIKITLKHLGFSVVKGTNDNYVLIRSGVELEKVLFTEGAAWSRAAALAGLIDPMNSWMIKDAIKIHNPRGYSVHFDMIDNHYTVVLNGDEATFASKNKSLILAVCNSFNRFMEHVENEEAIRNPRTVSSTDWL